MKRILFSFIILSTIGCRLTKTDDINTLSYKNTLKDRVETYWEYIFDCKTGKYTRCEYERYTKKMNEIPNLPILKKSKEYQEQLKETPYKTFQDKTYKF